MSTTRPLLTQREAATACGVSRTTIRRRREAGELPGAVLDNDRGWLIPVEDLLAAGFRLNAPAPPDTDTTDGKAVNNQTPAGTRQDTAPDETAAALQAELERLRHEHALALAQEQHARALAEAEARHLKERLDERAVHIEDLQRALAALTPAPAREAIAAPVIPAPAPADAQEVAHGSGAGRRRRWWPGRD
ncbi:hypothetical protein SUDANB176_07869 (plasmid) [Streptomyces sp. enrichment culture]|uniref:helix-turn-helix transcriptional regulator n=1 Tax=Streptomyces sp. enrichment culture TaxID=1795815 RepID=UPI003F54A8A8